MPAVQAGGILAEAHGREPRVRRPRRTDEPACPRRGGSKTSRNVHARSRKFKMVLAPEAEAFRMSLAGLSVLRDV